MSRFNYEGRLDEALQIVRGTSPCEHTAPVVLYVQNHSFRQHPDSVMIEMNAVLRSIGHIYRYGNNIVFDTGESLKTFVEDGTPCPNSDAFLANHFFVKSDEKESIPQPPSLMFLKYVFNNNSILDALPTITRYAKMPIYDADFNLLQPGYHSESGVLIHGEPIQPISVCSKRQSSAQRACS